MESAARFFIPPEDHYLILEPRVTCKTRLILQLLPDALRIDDLSDPETLKSLSARTERLRALIAAWTDVNLVVNCSIKYFFKRGFR